SLIANLTYSCLVRLRKQAELAQAQRWIDQEVREISRIQNLLLPSEINVRGIEVAFKFLPYKGSSGDYFELTSLGGEGDPGQPQIFAGIIADVSGHGPSATVEAAMLDAILRTFRPEERVGAERVIEYINQHFFTRKDRGKFVTMCSFQYNPATRLLKYCVAGHPMPYMLRGDQLIQLNQAQGIPVGVIRDHHWYSSKFEIQKGDILFIYTDVVLEARNPANQEFGQVRLEQTLRSSAEGAHAMVDDVEMAIKQFSQREMLEDDLTLCAIEFTH
ncbi:MAG: PP2C family protein-serine/threonine phosphatase, partial [Gammaproteobacteria bacterium]|nr:PP2C family protein-serine/threonine phosphatase [Gammaproteobacteria bacterium]